MARDDFTDLFYTACAAKTGRRTSLFHFHSGQRKQTSPPDHTPSHDMAGVGAGAGLGWARAWAGAGAGHIGDSLYVMGLRANGIISRGLWIDIWLNI